MKKYLALLFIISIFSLGATSNTKAQRLKLLGGNTLNGAMNGVVLGGATMALKNSDDFKPVRIGLGAGTLYGIGVGIYDISQIDAGQQFYISGTFNDGVNSSIIVLLDTFYGAAAGAVIASSVSLIIQEPIVDALQYGSGIGAWAGFGFGIFDSFVLAKGPNYSAQSSLSQSAVNGLLTYSNASQSVNIGMLSPKLITQKKVTGRTVQLDYHTAVDLVQLKVQL
ncbi:hypothetical protein [Fodinibius halophilus]|uniref:Uncharacterized protein n=1 Tax=Fodinibius halophilus TaxID=1736908 RepID=A0A6M1SYM2_9BACT|nr:hypothetical protein [Fodinibius halophilus]NGP88436.1 hypothetical protein [Fodinibius halophilus]